MIKSDLMNNYHSALKSQPFVDFENKIDKLMEFLDSLSGLVFASGHIITCITNKRIHFFNTNIIDSSVRTLNSIKSCCRFGSFGDANVLVRKVRDDLMLFLYILEVLNNRKDLSDELSEELNGQEFAVDKFVKMVENVFDIAVNGEMKTADDISVDAWFDDTVESLLKSQKKNLYIGHYMNYLERNASVKEALEKYNLYSDWYRILRKLNDYTHNNGQSFTESNITREHDAKFKRGLEEITAHVDYIVSVFLILLILVEPLLIASADLAAYLDCDLTPPEDCQYWIAPFVQEFIDEHINKINPELKVFLKQNNKYGMLID